MPEPEPVHFCVNFDFDSGMYDGSGNEGCIEKMYAFGDAMMMADHDDSGSITMEECYNVEDPHMHEACTMMVDWCDYNYDG